MNNILDIKSIKDLEDLSIGDIKKSVNGIEIPDPTYLTEGAGTKDSPDAEFKKHGRAYEAYLRWSALPKKERDPATELSFEKKWGLPKAYCAHVFRARKDFSSRRLYYFWEWMLEKLPDIVYSQYEKVIKDGNTMAAKFFADLIAHKLDVDKPEAVIQPLTIIGVPQEKIQQLFTPKKFEDVKGIIPIDQVEKK